MNLISLLEERSRLHPDRTALAERSGKAARTMSYQQLYTGVCAGSQFLREHELTKAVLILQPVGIDLYVSLLSCLHAGLTVVFVDPSASRETIRRSLELIEVEGFIGVAKAHLLRLTIPEIQSIPIKFHTTGFVPGSTGFKPHSSTESIAPCKVNAEHPALVTFTTGSTGQPKAVSRSHGFLLAQHAALQESLDLVEAEVDLVTLPVFAIANLASGMTSVIADTDLRYPARADSSAIQSQFEHFQITRSAASPAFFEKLHRDGMFPPFQKIYTGGAPVFPHRLMEIEDTHPDTSITIVYGSTEAEPITHIEWSETSPEDRTKMMKGGGLLVGKPVKAATVKIIPDRSGKTLFDIEETAVGEPGEIIVTGDHVVKGYLNQIDDEESKIKTPDQIWHRTGDAGYFDGQGRLWLSGRCGAAIRVEGGKPVYPFGIECAALGTKHMERCALMEHGGKPVLFVELSDNGPGLDAVKADLSHLSLSDIRVLSAIPMDPRHNAKVDYPALRKLIEREL